MDIGPGDHPFTVAEAIDYVHELADLIPDESTSKVLAQVAGMLETIVCTCGPVERGAIAPVLQLRPGTPTVS